MSEIKYYKIKFVLASPLAIGSGENTSTDSDVILDSKGNPVIPATAFAGVIRHYLGVECNDRNEVFGYINGQEHCESKIRFYDAVSVSDSFVTVRDCVALENKVAKKSAKFDMEAVESGAEFVTLTELRDYNDYDNQIREAIRALNNGYLRIGSKTSRGYGQIKITELKSAEFDLSDEKSRRKWLDFEPFDYFSDKCYENCDIDEDYRNKFTKIHLELKQNGAISIRSYTVKNADDISSADYVQLSTKDNIPVIPGTSWAGAFRERFLQFSDKNLTDKLFGFVDEKSKNQKKSGIYFSESRLNGGNWKVITRNSIDRFSAGTKDGALYTEKTYYNGKCGLDIFIADSDEFSEYIKILSAVICDLDRGFLAVGGLSSVGRGLFSVEKAEINGRNITDALKVGNISEMAGDE